MTNGIYASLLHPGDHIRLNDGSETVVRGYPARPPHNKGMVTVLLSTGVTRWFFEKTMVEIVHSYSLIEDMHEEALNIERERAAVSEETEMNAWKEWTLSVDSVSLFQTYNRVYYLNMHRPSWLSRLINETIEFRSHPTL